MSTLSFDHAAHPEITGRAARTPDPCALVIFGGSGDLTRRKLMPALFTLHKSGVLPAATRIVGVADRDLTEDAYRAEIHDAVKKFSPEGEFDESVWPAFATRLGYLVGKFDDPALYGKLKARLAELAKNGTQGNLLQYMATPPSVFGMILQQLRTQGMILPHGEAGPWQRVMVEKPFGRDYRSAVALDAQLHAEFAEEQIFRIDHYLGKETVQNILVFRFANSIFEPLWNRKYIDHVQITAAEDIGVEGRGAFYEESGVLRDIVQNHLLQVLSLTAMEPPASGDAERIRDEKTQVFRSLRPIPRAEAGKSFVLGQYRGYRDEPNVAKNSTVPTFAAMKLYVDNWRWHGVPFYLRAGKGLAKRVTEIAIQFQPIPLALFSRDVDTTQPIQPNVLVLTIQPQEGITMRFASKVPGQDMKVGAVTMDFKYASAFGHESADAYQRILLDGMRGDQTLFAREDAVEISWQFMQPILEAAAAAPVPIYERGSWGPPSSDALLDADGREWRKP